MSQNHFNIVYKVAHAGGSGSCFYLASHQIFVTNYHVVAGFREVAIHDQDRNPFLAKVALVNPDLDIALLTTDMDCSALESVELAPNDTLSINTKVYVAGFPFGMGFTVTEGTVSSPKQLLDGRHFVQTDAAVNPGNSGGPIFNEEGQVVAVVSCKLNHKDAESMGFGIRIEELRHLLENIEGFDRNKYQLQCNKCDGLIDSKAEYCPHCGSKTPDGTFQERELTDLAKFCESAISRLAINPVVVRDGFEKWRFYVGSCRTALVSYDDSYLFCQSKTNYLPKKNVGSVLDYLITQDIFPYKFALEERGIFLVYRIHLTDITPETEESICEHIIGLARMANEVDSYLVENFDCEYTENTKLQA